MARANSYNILLKPVITEKAAHLAEAGKYVFMVANDANKISVANAVKEIYGIQPEVVNIINVKGKQVTRGRITGTRKDWKKAVVTLPAGKSIQIYEGV
jgi:large subunit ribosomal protein L23